ncbi:MAG: hypothetical protein M0P63_12235 [Azoarcus sp.]|jgi:hypothetical protein|nr:hypothetical protein [Azoarcus sp.]
MFRKLLMAVGLATATAPATAAEPPAFPAQMEDLADIYAMLFCDDLDRYRPLADEPGSSWKQVVFNERPDPERIRALAGSEGEESRVRALAFHWLRQHAEPVPQRKLLGVILEYAMGDGFDVLAAYLDGSLRYLNHAGKTVFVEREVDTFRAPIRKLFELSQQAVDRLGPWSEARRPPPAPGMLRLSFLVSDGLYFGEGRFVDMEADPVAGPIVRQAGAMVNDVVNRVLKREGAPG